MTVENINPKTEDKRVKLRARTEKAKAHGWQLPLVKFGVENKNQDAYITWI